METLTHWDKGVGKLDSETQAATKEMSTATEFADATTKVSAERVAESGTFW